MWTIGTDTGLMPLAAGTSLQPAETLERDKAVLFEAGRLKQDSEGAGRHRGGFAVETPFRVPHGDAQINVHGDRETVPACGSGGGGGFGPPEERRPEWVLDNVRHEPSIERARDVYKAVITVVDQDLAEHVVDEEATATLRAS